jgi:hypothetical protein
VLVVLLWYVIKRNVKTLKGFMSGKTGELLNAGIKNYLLVTVIVYVLLISANEMWWGGWTFGPRHLIPVVFICLFEGASFLVSNKINPFFFYIASAIGLVLAWMDKATKIYMIPDGPPSKYGNPFMDVVFPDFMRHKLNSNTLGVFALDLSPEASIYLWLLLFIGAIIFLSQWYVKLYPRVKLEPVKPVKAVATDSQKKHSNMKKRK